MDDTFQSDLRVALEEPKYKSLVRMVSEFSACTPNGLAIQQEDRQWTFADLTNTASALARSIRPKVPMAVTGQQSFGLIAGILAVLAGGGVLLMIDPDLPDRRQRMMVDQSSARRLLVVGELPKWMKQESWDDVTIVEPNEGAVSCLDLPEPSPNDPAYIFFTSGSTGLPKGVVGSQKGLSHFLNWQRDTFRVGPADRVAQLTSLSFDVVLRSIFLALVSGGTLCLPPAGTLPGNNVLSWMKSARITIVHTVPSLAQAWLIDAPAGITLPELRLAFFAGEPLHDSLVRRWRSKFPFAQIVNLYGPTETTLAKVFYNVPSEPDPGVQPIGRPLPQTQVFVLDECGVSCTPGKTGEIVLRTPFRTLGYINARDEQNQYFIRNPLRDDPTDLLYRTGDRGRYRADGILEILGRFDGQVKIHGVRVEPEEVRAAITKHPRVESCVVVARPGPANTLILVAYIVSLSISAAELRYFLSKELPAAMIPSLYMFMDRLPLGSNGKVDHTALPPPSVTRTFVAPRTQMERTLAALWGQALDLEKVGLEDNFFELGGDSLRLEQVRANLVLKLNRDISIIELFQYSTIRSLANHLNFKSDTQFLCTKARQRAAGQLATRLMRPTNGENKKQ